MTLSEFKAWFSGYTEGIEEKPTQKQWDRIKARVEEIDNMPTTQTIYVDRYFRDYYRPWMYMNGPYAFANGGIMPLASAGGASIVGNASRINGVGLVDSGTTPLSCASNTANRPGAAMNSYSAPQVWDSAVAMAELGKADALADAA